MDISNAVSSDLQARVEALEIEYGRTETASIRCWPIGQSEKLRISSRLGGIAQSVVTGAGSV